MERNDILRLDDLISALQFHRSVMGNCEVGIDDLDTGYHLKIAALRISNRYPDRLLVAADGFYGNSALFEPRS